MLGRAGGGGMIDACYCDYEPASIVNIKIVTARKPHRCCECGCDIRLGERYENVWGIWDSPETYHTCSRCLAIREYVQAHVPCFCWAYSEMLEEARDTIREYAWQVPGMGMEVGRLWVAMRRRAKADKAARKATK